MAQSGRFGLSVRVLGVLAGEPDAMHTSAVIAEAVGSSPVMVRRIFAALHKAGFIEQKKGPAGGARLKHSAKSIGLGDLFVAIEPDWLMSGEKTLDAAIKKARTAAVAAMNDTSIAGVGKKMKK